MFVLLLFCLNLVRVGLHHSASARQVSDPHLDAKVFPFAHPYGTGSVNAEGTSVQPQRVCRNRMLSLQSFFRRSSRYAFWQLDMMIKRHLFFFNLHRVNSHRKSTAAPNDKFAQVFGTIIPRNIPESSAWWKARFCLCVVVSSAHVHERRAEVQSRELAAICDDAESGLPPTRATPSSFCAPRAPVRPHWMR